MTNHFYYIVPELGRFKVIRDLLEGSPEVSAMVFCQAKKDVTALAKQLQHQFALGGLHGDTPTVAREEVVSDWSNQKFRLLITTPGMGQSLGNERVAYIFNYQLPQNADAYIQTLAEMPAENGTVVTLVNSNQEAFLNRIQENLDIEILKHPDCIAEFMDASSLAEMKKQGGKSPLPRKQLSKGSMSPSAKSRGNQPNVPARHV